MRCTFKRKFRVLVITCVSLNEKILSESEITRLIWNGEKNPRNRARLQLLYGAIMRVSELCALKWKDLAPRSDSGQVTVRFKGSRSKGECGDGYS